MIILLPVSILSVAFWAQSPAGGPKPPVAAAPAKPAVTIKPAAAPKVAAPAVSPVKGAAAKAVAIAANPKPAKPGEPVVLTIGADKITQSQFEDIMAALPDQFKAQLATPQGKREFARQYAEMKSMAIEGKMLMERDRKARTQGQLGIDQAMANFYMQESMKVDDSSARKYYDEHQGEFENANGRHILVRFKGSPVPLKPEQKDLTEEEALAKVNDLRKRIAAGEDFAALAKAESDDTGSGAAGGSLGDFTRGRMVPPFDQAAFSLPIGLLSEAVKTQFGYHLIQIQSRKAQSFDEVKKQIESKQRPEMTRKAIDEAKKRHAIVIEESYFGKD